MNICYISNCNLPSHTANSIQVMKMCQAMKQLGNEVQLISPLNRKPENLESEKIWQHYGIRHPFSIKRLNKPAKFGEQAYSLMAVLWALRAKADVVFTRNLRAALIAAKMKIPVICEIHQMPGGYGGPIYLIGFALGRTVPKILVPITNSLKSDLFKSFPSSMKRLKITVQHDGVDLEQFENIPNVLEARNQLGMDLHGFYAGYSGHFYKGKGLDVVLELAKKCNQIQFLIMGGYPREVDIQRKKLLEKGINNVVFYGFVPNTDLPLHLAACDVLLLPNQKTVSGSGGGNIGRWTSPLKLFEYMASNRLVIASDLPVLREVLSQENAILCNPEKISEWEAALKMACNDQLLRHRKAERLNSEARDFSWTSRAKRCLDALYEEKLRLEFK